MEKSLKNILCIRADNMGDVIMSSPAFHALKISFNCKITLLTSSAGSLISDYIPDIDETIVADVPWVKTDSSNANSIKDLVESIQNRHFDAAIIFTVYSQSALPAAMLAYMANIPQRIAYCRENPYNLLTTWLPDKEPYAFIQHQVERDLQLVNAIGANTSNNKLQLKFSDAVFYSLNNKLVEAGVALNKQYIILHPGVSEKKREYPTHLWKEIVMLLKAKTDYQIVFTGASSEQKFVDNIISGEKNIYSVAGKLSIEELINFTKHAAAVCCVNTVIAHIAAAAETPVVVLYALTNPQHTPWCKNKTVLYFPVTETLKSKNEIIRYVNDNCLPSIKEYPEPETVVQHILEMPGYVNA